MFWNRYESSLMLSDILPINEKSYDKNRAPKYFGQPTVVYFHVTVLSIDTINEESMVSNRLPFVLLKVFVSFRFSLLLAGSEKQIKCHAPDLCGRYLPGAELEGPSTAASGEHDRRVPQSRRRLAPESMASWLLLQKRQKSHLPRDERTQPLPMALPRQDSHLHGQVISITLTPVSIISGQSTHLTREHNLCKQHHRTVSLP